VSLSELRITVPDRRGVLAEITSVAADAGVGILDFEVTQSVDSPQGILVLVIGTPEAPRLGGAVRARGYRCQVKKLR
jgi:predicted amino acid-binding ACT domain protein